MPAAQPATCCPFCDAEVPRKASVCPSCQAQRRPRGGMSPGGFKAFALLWLCSTLALALAAVFLALLPWLPGREAPPYALRLVGAQPQAARCTVEVVTRAGSASVTSQTAVPCPGAAALPPGPLAQAPVDASRRRLAAVLHGVLVLSLAAGLSWALRIGLRPVFTRAGSAGWVRRTAH